MIDCCWSLLNPAFTTRSFTPTVTRSFVQDHYKLHLKIYTSFLLTNSVINLHIMPAFIPFSLLAAAAGAAATGISATPHDSYSSSVGVLGCKINTDRVAYWPDSVDCDKICVKLTYEGRSVNLLRIDQSGGAHDISYDAWNYLQTGESATTNPISGGGVAMEYEEVDASECADLIKTDDGKLPFSASNSMNFVSSCLSQPNSWVAKNYALYNIQDADCSWGYDEQCTLDLATSNQPSCPHALGSTQTLTTTPVYDIKYPSGEKVEASSGKAVSDVRATWNSTGLNAAQSGSGKAGAPAAAIVALISGIVMYPILSIA